MIRKFITCLSHFILLICLQSKYLSLIIMQPSKGKLDLSLQQSNISVVPLTQNEAKPLNAVSKKYEKQIGDSYLYLTYTSHPSPVFYFRVIKPSSLKVYEIEMTKQVLTQMDPAVLATFDTVQSMYNQFVEIIKTQPEDLSVCDDGILKLRITVALKSGIKKRELILETQCRKMTEAQELKLQLEAQKQSSQKKISELIEAQEKFKKQIAQLKAENSQLKNVVKELSKQLRNEVQGIKLKQNKQRSSTEAQISSLKKDVLCIKQNMTNMDSSLKFLMTGAKKVFLTPNIKNKCFRPGHKENSFKIENYQHEGKQLKKIVKLGKQKWAQLVLSEPLYSGISYFEIEVLKTKNNYICIGACSHNCIEEQDSKWSKNSITLFLLDRSIISEGKEVENGLRAKELYNQKQVKAEKATKTTNIRVIVNGINKTISWEENQERIGIINFSDQFSNLCKANQIHPLIICADEEDEIVLR